MSVCDAERSGIPHQRFVFVIADATCRRRDASGYRDTRWIIYYDSPFNSDTHVRCALRLLLLFFFIFSYEGEAAYGESVVLGDACGVQPLLSAFSHWHLAVTTLMHLRENGRRRHPRKAAQPRLIGNTQHFITVNLAYRRIAGSQRAASEKSTNNRRTTFHRRPNLFIIRAYTRV